LGGPVDPGFGKLIPRVALKLATKYETEVLHLPDEVRFSLSEHENLILYVKYGCGDPATAASCPPDRFHPAIHEPRYDSPEDVAVWTAMIKAFEVPEAFAVERLLWSEELATPEVPGDPRNPSGPLDLTRILAPPPEDPMARRADLTNGLHHMRVIARQTDRMWGPIVSHAREVAARPGRGLGPDDVNPLARQRSILAMSLVVRYEAEVLGLPEEFRTTGEELRSFVNQVSSHCPDRRDEPVPWRFHIKLHQPRYSELEDREIWERCLALIPDDLPEWLLKIARSEDIARLEGPRGDPAPRRRSGYGGTDEREPYGTEEDGPQPW